MFDFDLTNADALFCNSHARLSVASVRPGNTDVPFGADHARPSGACDQASGL